jgi:hypothetical protein
MRTMQKHNTMLKSQPATYVKSMAIEIAQGALISGSEILLICQYATARPQPRYLLFCDVSGGVVIGHSPRNGQEAEKERESNRCPARGRIDIRKDIASAMLVLGLSEQRNAAGDQDEHVEDDICFGHFLHPVCGQRIDQAAQDCESGHDANDGSSGWEVGEGPRTIQRRAHRDSSKQHLRRAIFGRCNACDLAQQVNPSDYPAD